MSRRVSGTSHHVVVIALSDVLPLDLGIPLQVFGSWPDGPYRLTVCAERPGLVPVHGAPAMSVEHGLDCLKTADTVVVPGQTGYRARELLESTDLTVEGVARHCGLGTPANFRTLFKENVGVTPSAYRGTFRFTADDGPAARPEARPIGPRPMAGGGRHPG